MDVLREREVKDSLERQLQDEQKVRGEYPIIRRVVGRAASAFTTGRMAERNSIDLVARGSRVSPSRNQPLPPFTTNLAAAYTSFSRIIRVADRMQRAFPRPAV